MADPHHVEELDALDRWTVGLYRAGLFVAAGGVLALAALHWQGAPDGWGRWLVLFGVALIVADLHLYDRKIRWTISAAGWLSAVLMVGAAVAGASAGPWLGDAGLGFAFVVFSAVALKERKCFKLPLVVAIPPILGAALLPLRLGFDPPAAIAFVVAGGALLVLAVAKVRMPLHYDIGNKRNYQV
jgi:uncharacterized integral membrane protein